MTGAPLRLLYFAWLRERVGVTEEDIGLPEGVTNVGDLVAWLRARGANWDAAFGTGRTVRFAVNQEFALADQPLSPGDEVAFFPPVTGG